MLQREPLEADTHFLSPGGSDWSLLIWRRRMNGQVRMGLHSRVCQGNGYKNVFWEPNASQLKAALRGLPKSTCPRGLPARSKFTWIEGDRKIPTDIGVWAWGRGACQFGEKSVPSHLQNFRWKLTSYTVSPKNPQMHCKREFWRSPRPIESSEDPPGPLRVLKISQAHWEFWRSPRPTESFEDLPGPVRVLKISQAHWEFWRSPRPPESQFQHPPDPEGAISGHDSSAEVLSWPPPSLKKTPVWELGADLLSNCRPKLWEKRHFNFKFRVLIITQEWIF